MIKLLPLLYEATGRYYRATLKYLGKVVIFKPNGYYEEIDDDGRPSYMNDTLLHRSNIRELCASKYIGGAVLGLYSMMRYNNINNNDTIAIYEINEKPDKDISNWSVEDFEYIKEVRYRKDVKGTFLKKIKITKDMKKHFNILYEILSAADFGGGWIEDEDEYEKNMEVVRGMHNYLSKIK